MDDEHPLPGTLVILAVGVLGATLIGFLGAWWWVFDLVANLRLHLAVLAAVLSVALLLARQRGMALATFVGLLLNLALVAPLLLGGPAPARADASTLDVTFFNAKPGVDRDAMISHLEDRDDDVIVFASATTSLVEDLETADLGPTMVSGPHLHPHGLPIVVMTRDPDAEVTVREPSDQVRDWLVEAVVELDGRPLHVLGGHPMSPKTSSRAERRDLVLDWIGEWSGRRDEAVLVTGDLNATPWSVPFRSMLARSGLSDSQRMHGVQPSWPAGTGPLGLPIDHVLHSDDLTVLQREVGPSFGSDHLMVHARIARRATTAQGTKPATTTAG